MNPYFEYAVGQDPAWILVLILSNLISLHFSYCLTIKWIFLGERRYGHLAFSTNEKKLHSAKQAIPNDCLASDFECNRLLKYLKDQFNHIRPCVDAVHHWTYRYNGSNPPVRKTVLMPSKPSKLEEPTSGTSENSETPNQSEETILDERIASPTSQYPLINPADIYLYCMEQLTTCLSEMKSDSASPGNSSGYYSINCNLQTSEMLKEETSFFSKEVQDDLEFWSLMRDDDFDSTPIIPPVCISLKLNHMFNYGI